jgi:cupin 2 domain-containing protein
MRSVEDVAMISGIIANKRPSFEVRPLFGSVVCCSLSGQAEAEVIFAGGAMHNLFADLPSNLPEELVEVLVESEHFRIERIVSTGHASPEGFWYDQAEAEWVMLQKGAARLRFETGMIEMKPGDFLLIPAHQRHRVEWTAPNQPTVWLAVFISE